MDVAQDIAYTWCVATERNTSARTQRNIRFPNDLWAAATKLATEQGRSTTDVILEATAAALDERTVTLPRQSSHIVRRSGGPEYLHRMIVEHTEAWRTAVQDLAKTSWSRAEIRAACDALHGIYVLDQGGLSATVAELRRATAEPGFVADHELDEARWRAHLDALESSPGLCAALLLVILEWWKENPECERIVDGM